MADIIVTSTPRGRLEWAAIVGLPVLANALLAAYLVTAIGDGSLPIVGDVNAPPAVVGSPVAPLPESARSVIVGSVDRETNSEYECDGPWRVARDVAAWSCRTEDAVAVLQGAGADRIFLIDVTWFGFDETRTELPAWTEAVFGSSPQAAQAARWVAEHVGTDARTRIGGATIAVNGSEGARTLVIQGE